MKIVIQEDELVVELTFVNRFYACRCSDVRVPLASIRLPVRRHPEEVARFCKGMRIGTYLPYCFAAGTFYHFKSPPDFYYASSSSRAIALDLISPPSRYRKVIVGVRKGESVEQVAEAIEAAVRAYHANHQLDEEEADAKALAEPAGVTAATKAGHTSLPELKEPLIA